MYDTGIAQSPIIAIEQVAGDFYSWVWPARLRQEASLDCRMCALCKPEIKSMIVNGRIHAQASKVASGNWFCKTSFVNLGSAEK